MKSVKQEKRVTAEPGTEDTRSTKREEKGDMFEEAMASAEEQEIELGDEDLEEIDETDMFDMAGVKQVVDQPKPIKLEGPAGQPKAEGDMFDQAMADSGKDMFDQAMETAQLEGARRAAEGYSDEEMAVPEAPKAVAAKEGGDMFDQAMSDARQAVESAAEDVVEVSDEDIVSSEEAPDEGNERRAA